MLKYKMVFSTSILCIIFFFIVGGCASVGINAIVIENDYYEYEISTTGENIHFYDKLNDVDYLDTNEKTKCASILVDSITIDVSSVTYKDDQLLLKFGDTQYEAIIHLSPLKDRIVFRVESASPEIEEFTFLNIPLTLEAQPYEPFATCALSMNLFTHVRLLPPLQNKLWARSYKRFGIVGSEVTLLGLPQEKLLPVIRDVVSNAKDIPFSDAGGAWALMKDEGYGSYLMNFGSLTEETVDEWIETCERLGVNQIDSHGGGSFFEFGTFDLGKEKWPDGWDSFKRINSKLHKAGISHIFHTYAFFIDKTSRYVTPTPNKDLGYARTFTLAKPIDISANEIVVKESTEDISTITGFHTENSVTLRIGDELIEFSEVTKTEPYKFIGLKRGANGTEVSSHSINETIFHMSERFGRFVPGPNTDLFNEMARRHAEIVNHCNFDGIYLDAIDGSAVLGGPDDFWYYGTKFLFELVKHLKRPVGMEMSSMSHHWWHYRSRWQAWDRPNRGYKRFIDIHLASIKAPSLFLLPNEIKSNEWEHGIWPGHTPLIDKYAGIEKGQTLLPLHLGWWGNQTWSPPQIEPTFSDDIEYLGCKMIGNDAGFSQLGGVDKKTLDEIPLFKRATEIMKQYEDLRHRDYFGEEVKRLLRQPGKEYTLFQEDDGEWNFKPIIYAKHKVAGLDHATAHWTINNEFETQPLKLRLEPLMSVKPYDSPSGIILTDFSKPDEFINEFNADGVSGQLSILNEKIITGEGGGVFSAQSTGDSPKDGSYVNIEKSFTPLLDLNSNQALGVWINGDSSGQILNLSLRSPVNISQGARGDHFIKIDFTGWKYFELVEIESSEISNYIWPNDSHFYVYDSYRHTVKFDRIEKLQLWYNNLPSDKEVSTSIGPIKALPMVLGFIENPSITIGEEKITFPIKMESGMYLEFRSADDCKLYGSKGELLAEVKPEGTIPELKKGDNKISFSGEGSSDVNTRMQITVISEDDPLDIR